MSLYLLICVCLLIGYLWGWASCASRDHGRKEIDNTLASYAEYQKQRDVEFPEMIGKWGKP